MLVDLSQLEAALNVFGTLDPGRLPLHHIQVLLMVARKGGATYRELETELNLTNASISRSVTGLSDEANHRLKPLGLLAIERDPAEGRRYRVRLTPKGKALVKALEAIK